MKYLILIALALTLTGCPAVEKYKAEQEVAKANQMAEQAKMVQAQEESAQMQTLANAARPTYWPIIVTVAIFALVLLTFMRWHMVTVSHVAAGQPVRELRMLPGDVPFGQMRIEARRQGYDLEVSQGAYFLVDNEGNRKQIRALIERGEG
jgi:hypothetical protein